MRLEFNNLKKEFKDGTVVFKSANLYLEGNKLIGIIGQSGCGKTTSLNILGMLDNKIEGSYFVNGENVKTINKKRFEKLRISTFSYVFQTSNLFEEYNTYKNLVLPLKFQHKKVSEEEIDEILKKLNIFDLKYKKVKFLSGGEKQRIAIARAVLLKSPVLLADEPTGALDFVNSKEIIDIFRKIVDEYKFMCIVVTHNLNILEYFDEVYEVGNGEIKVYNRWNIWNNKG